MKTKQIQREYMKSSKKGKRSLFAAIKKNPLRYALLLPALFLTIYFSYVPMGGALIAFMKYDIFGGFFGSPWVGLDNFKQIFSTPMFAQSIKNTVYLLAAFRGRRFGNSYPLSLQNTAGDGVGLLRSYGVSPGQSRNHNRNHRRRL